MNTMVLARGRLRRDRWLAWGLTFAETFAGWLEAERGRFVLWLPLAMAAGAAADLSLRFEPSPWAGPAALLASGLAGIALRRHPVAAAPAWLALAAALGFSSGQFATARAPPTLDLPTGAVMLSGTVRAVETLPDRLRITLDPARLNDGADLARAVRIKLKPDDPARPATGDMLRVRGRVGPPPPPTYPGAWDLQRDDFFNGLGGYGGALGRAEITATAPPDGARAALQGLRETIVGRVDQALPGESGAIAATLLTGGTAQIPAADRAAFRDSGLAHLLAIAGLHIGIVMGLVLGAVRLGLAMWERAALHWPIKAIAAVAALAAGAAYMLLTGGHVPIIRSFAMACLFTLGVTTGRRAISLRGWALAMAAIVLIAPAEVTGVSFQMSFSAVLALIAGYAALRPLLAHLHRRPVLGHIVALALTSALAGTFSAPYAAYHFGHVQLYYIPANMLAVPLAAFWVMPAGMIALVLMPLHLEALALAPMGWGIEAILWVGRTVASWPAATVAVPHMPAWGLALLSVGLAWLGLWRTRVRLAGLAAITVALASPAVERPPDLLVSADARLIGLRSGGRMLVEGAGDDFTRDAWRAYWAAGAPVALGDGIACAPAGCPLPGGARLLRQPADASACTASLLISAEPITLRCPRGAVPRIDRFSVWRNGAHAVWLDPDGSADPVILSDRAWRGDRPWVPEAKRRERTPALPKAASE